MAMSKGGIFTGGHAYRWALFSASYFQVATASGKPYFLVVAWGQAFFLGDHSHKWTLFSGDQAHKWALFSGEHAHKWALFSGDQAHKWALFSGDHAHMWDLFQVTMPTCGPYSIFR